MPPKINNQLHYTHNSKLQQDFGTLNLDYCKLLFLSGNKYITLDAFGVQKRDKTFFGKENNKKKERI